jgi:hypothetical protein
MSLFLISIPKHFDKKRKVGDFMSFSQVIHSLHWCYNVYVEPKKNFYPTEHVNASRADRFPLGDHPNQERISKFQQEKF